MLAYSLGKKWSGNPGQPPNVSLRVNATLAGIDLWAFGAAGDCPTPALAVRIARVDQDADRRSVEELMERYVEGSADAFSELYRRIAPNLLGYLLRLTRDRMRAEDLLQVTFTKIHRARQSYLRGAPVLPWVLAIARRSFLDERRHARTRNEDLSPDGTLPEPRPEPANVPSDLSDALETALDALPETYREAIQLTKISGLSIAEAAGVLGTTETAVKLRVHRGYNQLRKELERFTRTP
jgi:RNA polymerase sigma-70 factor (ECF subfamily)